MDVNSHLNITLKKLTIINLVIGLSYDVINVTRKEKIKRHFMYFINLVWLNCDILGAIVAFIDGIQTGKSFEEMTYIAPCVAISLLTNFRALTLIVNGTKISDLITTLRQLEDYTKSMKNSERDEIFKKGTKYLHSVINISKILNYLLILTFFISPLILIVIIYYMTNKWELLLPFLVIYPFDSHDIKYWPFVYLHQFWSEIVGVLLLCSFDFLLYICCTFINIQFRLLQCEFLKINKSMFTDEESFDNHFTQLVKWHQELIRVSAILEQVYSKPLLFNFVCSSIMICLTGFNVMIIENKAVSNMFLIFLSVSLAQIYFVCFFGDLLMRSSSGVSDAIYKSKWYYADVRDGKNLHIVQTRAQRPCKLTAFGFADVNLRAFMSILSTAWSYFALLKTLYSPSRT